MTEEPIETLLVDVRASTRGFAADIRAMRGELDSGLVDGFAQAGHVLERGLLSALRRGSLGFDDLKRVALRAMDDIATQAVQGGLGSLFGTGGASSSPVTGVLGNAIGALFGLPGRATGGPVSPGRGYLVGERGPEMFVPTSAGCVEAPAAPSTAPRDVRVAIQLASPRGGDAPVALRRSARQVAANVRRALREY